MAERQTEKRHAAAQGLELRPPVEILSLLAAGQAEAAKSVATAVDALADGAALAAASIEAGGRLVYVAAGSSGLMALADALELPGTYGIAPSQIVVLLAGGLDSLVNMTGGPEDDGDVARAAIEDLRLDGRDCVIGLTASGQTPYPLEALAAAKAAGARTIGISNNAGAPVLDIADVGICLPTPPEVIAGSTRMGAGTAQKIALNMLSTLMAIHLGHVHDGFMVNVIADNIKLRERARGIVATISGVSEAQAAAALETSKGAVKPAVLLAAGVASLGAAEAVLAEHKGRLRPALAALQA
ncbi:N-acetylmuramic acid 6-phosphate etherase [Devosia sp. Root685]|uniref:N-acetylmuramic acid 6-phosphate etherase n=1 Tax=Devosia sp. Root685 TaxID=1736587 RepID=UPI0006F7FBD7|nr:N-acetylmuramic acid 6-phosphate etherase [Devosia sp. Root685]KRB01094.1 N-acetylmuramic acid 6-phosphate etherase [Devosia sp. Root685]